MHAYEYVHVVSFEETNLVGNVYYANHVRWQGRCRELFLRDHAPDVLEMLKCELALVTIRVACDYLAELAAFDKVLIRMFLESQSQNRITMRFEYWRKREDPEGNHAEGDQELVARGEQQVACMERRAGGLVPVPVPPSLGAALRMYGTR